MSKETNRPGPDRPPRAETAMRRAESLHRRAAARGFDWSNAEEIMDKVAEELDELRGAHRAGDRDALEHEIGDLFLAVASLSRFLGLDGEALLAQATDRFELRFSAMEAEASSQGLRLEDLSIEELDRIWEVVKRRS